jgi:aminocarboxymuconate-semialdehyde decarboxylase
MRIIDTHFHWYPRSVYETLCKRTGYPRAVPTSNGGYLVSPHEEAARRDTWGDWFDLDAALEHMDRAASKIGCDFGVVCTTGPGGAFFSETDASYGYDAAQMWNDEMAGAVARYPGKVWATAVAPLQDPEKAIREMERAMKMGLVGVNVPGTIGPRGKTNIDDTGLEPFYDRAEKLGATLFLHPTDVVFPEMCGGKEGALYNALGRVLDLSLTIYRLVVSGIMERHPSLKVYVSHTGGALPFQSGRMDKNSKSANLPRPPSEYLKRMYTDTVQPHALGLKFAIDYYGVDHVMYGDDYPCWNPESALDVFGEIALSGRRKALSCFACRRRSINSPAGPVRTRSA